MNRMDGSETQEIPVDRNTVARLAATRESTVGYFAAASIKENNLRKQARSNCPL
jgi:hypothetical protein